MQAAPVLNILGILLTLLGGTMLAPMAIDLVMENPNWQAFGIAGLFTSFVGVCLCWPLSAVITQISG